MGAWATPSGDWGGISRSTMKSGRTRRWGIKRRAGCTEAGERRRPHGRQGDFAPAERRGARTAAGSRRECPPAGTAKEGWAKKRGLGLSLFLPAGSRGKTRWIEETQSYSLNWPKFCLDIGEHLILVSFAGALAALLIVGLAITKGARLLGTLLFFGEVLLFVSVFGVIVD